MILSLFLMLTIHSTNVKLSEFHVRESNSPHSNVLRNQMQLEQQCGLTNRSILRETINKLKTRSSKIIGGRSAFPDQFPWQVQIVATRRKETMHLCGGAIISQYHVLTAAHCFKDKRKHMYMIKAGKYNRNNVESTEQIFGIRDVHVHPHYQKRGYYSNDIAILRIASNNGQGFLFNEYVSSICLPPENEHNHENLSCQISGWGLQKSNDKFSMSDVLRTADVNIIDWRICSNKNILGESIQPILPSMLCAGKLIGGTDACGGDSGGPLSCFVNGQYVLYGIISWGDGCGQPLKPGVYTRVSHYIKWIEEKMS